MHPFRVTSSRPVISRAARQALRKAVSRSRTQALLRHFLKQIPGFESLPSPLQGILRVSTAASGSNLVMGVLRARYNERGDLLFNEVRRACLGAGGEPGTWTSTFVAGAKKAAPVGGLTPGTAYLFQVRAFGVLGFIDLSNSFSRMTI